MMYNIHNRVMMNESAILFYDLYSQCRDNARQN